MKEAYPNRRSSRTSSGSGSDKNKYINDNDNGNDDDLFDDREGGNVVYPTDTDAAELEEEQEDEEDYVPGGYHPVRLGDKFSSSRYTVTKKLGWGHFSTVWLAQDHQENRSVALKIVKSEAKYTETALDEINLLETSVKRSPHSPFRGCVVELYDWFKHRGPNGSHIVMVFEVLGPNLLTLIRQNEHRGMPIPQVKQMAKQILMGLHHLHVNCGIIHTDLKPENILVCIDSSALTSTSSSSPSRKRKHTDSPPPLSSSSSNASADMENGAISYKGHSKSPRPLKRPPPLLSRGHNQRISGAPDAPHSNMYNPSTHDTSSQVTSNSRHNSDGKSLSYPATFRSPNSSAHGTVSLAGIRVKIADLGNACWVDHHYTDDIQTRQYRAPEVILGASYDSSADIWSAGCTVFELLTGDFLFEPRTGKHHSKNDDHLAQIMELVGEFPRHVALSGRYAREYFDSLGELRHIRRIKYWKLKDVLREKYNLSVTDAADVADFILPMIAVDRRRRATAADMLNHPWLENVDV